MKYFFTLYLAFTISSLEAQIKFLIEEGKEVEISGTTEGKFFKLSDQNFKIEIANGNNLKFNLEVSQGVRRLQYDQKTREIKVQAGKIGDLEFDGPIKFVFTPASDNKIEATIKSIEFIKGGEAKSSSVLSSYKSGVAYYDAIALRDNSNTLEKDFIYIMRDYMGDSNADMTRIMEFINKNPFLRNTIAGKVYKKGPEAQSLASGLQKISLGAIEGIDVTNIADGLARFMVARMKEELNVMFFDQFNEYLKNDSDFGALFPRTKDIFKVAKNEIYNYQTYLPALREAFGQDLSVLIVNLHKWLRTASGQSALLVKIQNSPVYPYVALALDVVRQVREGTHPGKILHDLDAGRLKAIDKSNTLYESVKILDLFSQSLRSKSGEVYWISSDEFNEFEDRELREIYLGLLYEQSKKQSLDFQGKKFHEILTQLSETVEKSKEFLTKLKSDWTKIDNAIGVIRRQDGKASASDYLIVSQNIFISLQHLQQSELFTDLRVDHSIAENTVSNVLHASNLFSDLRSKSYNAAIYEIAVLLKDSSGAEGESFFTGFLKYGTFIASVSQAKDSDEVQKAIEAIALPSGSSRIKRESRVNISLNSYLGVFAGDEYISKSATANGPSHAFSAGIFAPVGVAFSLGGRKSSETKGGKSYCLFVSVVDIGALAAFRFKDNDSKIASTIELRNIIAPGAFFIYGFGKCPLSIGAGMQAGPQLREVTSSALSYSDNYYIRTHAFLAVDIPIFNLYTRKDKSK